MNRVMMTGLALGSDAGVCNACNFDFEWLLKYPSMFLWTDEILISKSIMSSISNENIPVLDIPILAKTIKLIVDLANEENLIKEVDPSTVVSQGFTNTIWKEVNSDWELLNKFFKDDIVLDNEVDPKSPITFSLNGYHYCSPYIATIYTTLALSQTWKANCFFNPSVLNYLTYKFGLNGIPERSEPGKFHAFNSVFNTYLPNITFLPEYFYYSTNKNAQCEVCRNINKCKDGYLLNLEKNFKKLLAWRDYDEIHQLKEVVNKIIQKRNKSGGIVNPNDILNDFKKIEKKYHKRLNLIFPKVERWLNIITMISTPISIIGVVANQPIAAISGGLLAGTAKFSDRLIKSLSSKMSWISFTAKEENLPKL